MKKKYLFGGLLVFQCAFAQIGALDPSLNPGAGADSPVQAIALQEDQKIIIGGDFLNYDGTPRKRLARLNADGSADPTFSIGSGANKLVTGIAMQPDSKIIVTGQFSIFNNTAKKRIVRLNNDGSIDTTFNTGFGANDDIESCVLEDDGKIMVGGMFTSFNWIARNGIARINPDGSLDNSFEYTGDPIEVTDIKKQPDGKYVVNAVTKILRLNPDGSIDNSFQPGSGTDYPIQSICIQSDGKILVGGYFTTWDGFAIGCIIRLETDGTIDTTFNNGSADYGVLSITEQFDGQLLISGIFAHISGVQREKVARLNPDGTLDPTFDPQLGPDNIVLHHVMQPDGRIILVGDFLNYNAVGRNRVARINGFDYLSTATRAMEPVASLYPNPAHDGINIFRPETQQVGRFAVYDTSGKRLAVDFDDQNHADISKLPIGTYIVKSAFGQKSYTTRFIKN